MEKLTSIYFIFIIPLIITIIFYFTKVVNLNSFLDCISFYFIGIVIFYFGNLVRKKMIENYYNK